MRIIGVRLGALDGAVATAGEVGIVNLDVSEIFGEVGEARILRANFGVVIGSKDFAEICKRFGGAFRLRVGDARIHAGHRDDSGARAGSENFLDKAMAELLGGGLVVGDGEVD